MATYKVIQDIEAEDKFLGPLTLKQFIFGAIAGFFFYLSFFAVTKGAGFLLAIFMPPALLGAFLAIPWSSEQSTEVWVLAKLRFRFKPKARIWDQAGLEELVTITVPKKIERQLTNGLNQTEIQSRLKALAETIDTRGWAVKNATLEDAYNPQPGRVPLTTERLIDPASLPQSVPDVDTGQYEDVLDESATVSENFDQMLTSSTEARKRQSLEKMQRARDGESLESIQQPEVNFTPPSERMSGYGTAPDDKALSEQLRSRRGASGQSNSHLRTIQVYPDAGSLAGTMQVDDSAAQPAQAAQADALPSSDDSATQQPQAQMTDTPDPAILNLAQNNDWNIETIARNAKRNDPGADEVVISLR